MRISNEELLELLKALNVEVPAEKAIQALQELKNPPLQNIDVPEGTVAVTLKITPAQFVELKRLLPTLRPQLTFHRTGSRRGRPRKQ